MDATSFKRLRNVQSKLLNTAYLVEADDFAVQALWSKFLFQFTEV